MITKTIPGMTRVAPIGSANAAAMPSPFFDGICWATTPIGHGSHLGRRPNARRPTSVVARRRSGHGVNEEHRQRDDQNADNGGQQHGSQPDHHPADPVPYTTHERSVLRPSSQHVSRDLLRRPGSLEGLLLAGVFLYSKRTIGFACGESSLASSSCRLCRMPPPARCTEKHGTPARGADRLAIWTLAAAKNTADTGRSTPPPPKPGRTPGARPPTRTDV
jgi:hypothetical protein